MAVNKIIYGGNILIDLTSDTVNENVLCNGYTAHKANGELITGNLVAATRLTPYYFDLHRGYVASNNGNTEANQWYYNISDTSYVDVYKIFYNHAYFVGLGNRVGNRFRVMYTVEDVTQITQNSIGTHVYLKNSPASFESVGFTCYAEQAYLVIQKTNMIQQAGVPTYVYDMTALVQ